MHFKVMIFWAFACKVTILYVFDIKSILKYNFLSICLQSNIYVCIWHQKHFQVMISLAFAFKVTILYIFGIKSILQ